MPTSTNVTNLKINTLTEAQYDTAVQNNTIGANELSIITDLDNAIQVDTMPTASADELGKVYQFIGTTGTYTHGYFYECVSDGQQPATYSWTQLNVQPQGSSLPSQTGNTGKFLTTDGTDASWATINALQNTGASLYALAINTSESYFTNTYIGNGQTRPNNSYSENTLLGSSVIATNNGGTGVGYVTQVGYHSIALGVRANASTHRTIQLGWGTNSESGTMCVALEDSNFASHNYKLLNSDGTIPKERLTNVVSTPSTMPTLAVADWSNNTQTVNVTGVTATNTVFVSPAPASAADYASAGIVCTAQGAGTLTFTCATVPSNDITVNVVCL